MCVFAQGVELNASEICKKNVSISLLEMRKVYDLVGQPSIQVDIAHIC